MAPQEASAHSSQSRQPRVPGAAAKRLVLTASRRSAALLILFGTVLASPGIARATDVRPRINVKAQSACEVEMLGNIDAREVFSGKAYKVLTEVARAYGRPTPHIYVFPGSWNMAYIAASTAVDGRGKIVVGQQAIERFDTLALRGFLGHEMAHLVSDHAAQGCNDYILRDPQAEAAADALAVRTLGARPVKAFLEQAVVLAKGLSWDAQHRLELLESSEEASLQIRPVALHDAPVLTAGK